MKIVRYTIAGEPAAAARLGVVVGRDTVGDLRGGYARVLADKGDGLALEVATARVPADLARFLAGGRAAQDALKATFDKLSSIARKDGDAIGLGGQPLFAPLANCTLHAPIHRPSKIIAVGRNYRDHLAEMKREVPFEAPSAWIKANSAILGPTDPIVKPRATQELDYETELTLVIGSCPRHIPQNKAYDAIAGYMVMSDVTARDIVRIERKEGNQLFGKMFDGFAPMGPWMVTADEIKDPMNLPLRTRVNGRIRQNSNTGHMNWNIRQLVSFLSQMSLEPGDVVLTGTPEGVARGHKPVTDNWFLKPGDVLESEVAGVGTLRNPIVDDSRKKPGWNWPAAPAFKG